MPFVLIKGKFVPDARQAYGDSVRFKPKNLSQLDKLEGRPANVGIGAATAGTVQLRFEGIDAIEKGAKKPESVDAKQSMFDLIGYDETNDPEPDGYILARMTDDKSGRPICFAYAGSASEPDAKDDVYLTPARLKRSVNYKQMPAGWAYRRGSTLRADARAWARWARWWRRIVMIGLALVAMGCGDKAAPKLKECQDAEAAGDFKAAVAACEMAASLDPASEAGKEAHRRIDKLNEKQKRKEADERAAELTKQAKANANALDDLKAKQDDAAKKVQDLEKAVGAPGSDDEKERLRKQLEGAKK